MTIEQKTTSKNFLYLFVFVFTFLAFLIPHQSLAATYTVNSTDDSDDGTCDLTFVDADTDCTLDEAIDAANANPGADTVDFSFDSSFADDGDGQWTINNTGGQLLILDETLLTGVSIWDTDDDRPGIKINSTTTGTFLRIAGSGATDSVIQGIELVSGAYTLRISAPNVIVGTNCDGINDEIERNVVYNTGGVDYTESILFTSGATNFRAKGNYVGILADGVTVIEDTQYGISVHGTAGPGIIGYEEGATCDASLQKNIVGAGGKNGWGLAIRIVGSTSNIRVAGNQIGIGTDNTSDLCGIGVTGIEAADTSNEIYLGTDGDGVEDEYEGNIIGNCWHGISSRDTPTNVRASGNIIGFGPDGTTPMGNDYNGVVARSTGMIVGWCDTTINATICSDSGNLANQANQIGFNGSDGVFMAKWSEDVYVFGNYIGTDSTGSADYGNLENGVRIDQPTDYGPYTIGGAGSNKTNLIKYNDGAGIYLHGQYVGNTRPALENYAIVNNTISSNGSHGINLLTTEMYGTPGPNDGTITDNLITNNVGDGIFLNGSSPLIQDNTITGNTAYGIRLVSNFEPTIGSYTNPYEALSPNNAARDVVSTPNITGNTIDSNTSGGIYMLDAQATNDSTLWTDNTIGTNGTFDIRQDWYGAIELLDRESLVPPSSNQITVSLTPANGLACTSNCIGIGYGANSANTSQGIFGPEGIVYDDVTTWFKLTDTIINTDGLEQSFNPYSVELFRDYSLTSGAVEVTFDGDHSNDTSTAGLDSGITTFSISRYQTPEVLGQKDQGTASSSKYLNTPFSGEPVSSLGISDSVIRWYFRFSETPGTLFSLYTDSVLIDASVSATDSGMFYFDETDLTAETEYCDRNVIAFHELLDLTSNVDLPCASTLIAGDIATQTGVADLHLSQRIYLVTEYTDVFVFSDTTDFPAGILFLFFSIGGTREVYKRRIKKSKKDAKKRTSRIYIGAGILLAVLTFLFMFTYDLGVADKVSAGLEYTLVTPKTELKQGDLLKVEFTIENKGTADAEDIEFHHPIHSKLSPNRQGVIIEGGSEATQVEVKDGSIIASIKNLPASGSAVISYEAPVILKQGKILLASYLFDSQRKKEYPPVVELNINNTENDVLDIAEYSTPYPVVPFSLLKSETGSHVYFIDASKTRRRITEPQIFVSWFDSFLPLQEVSTLEATSVPLGDLLPPRPGTWLVKLPEDQKIYAVEPGFILRWISNEDQIQKLFGQEWSTRVIDIDQSILATMGVGTPLEDGVYPDGYVITDTKRTCYIDKGACRELSKNGIGANHLQENFFVTVSTEVIQELLDLEPLITREQNVLFGE